MAFHYNPYDFLPKLPVVHADLGVVHRRPAAGQRPGQRHHGRGRLRRLTAAELVGLPRGDPQFRGHRVRPRRADGIGLLALGRRQPARDRHRPARRSRRRQRISRRRSHFGQRRRPEALHRRRAAARARSAPLLTSPCTPSASRSWTCPRDATPAYLGFNLFSKRSPAPSSTAPTSSTRERSPAGRT